MPTFGGADAAHKAFASPCPPSPSHPRHKQTPVTRKMSAYSSKPVAMLIHEDAPHHFLLYFDLYLRSMVYRTVGCCAHVMVVAWYLGYARYEEVVHQPARFLDLIINEYL
ncbi:unnamed protein product [Diatraea saccharalis]|uniref:Uncharacterized protein n=1 Tax=Diatraea saccharalis TaxID=40085 RepID=A0A9N9R6F7_9NEOP|nr:unnamed protein product [Diatraea saccharalis]